jgi:hypothetical protein
MDESRRTLNLILSSPCKGLSFRAGICLIRTPQINFFMGIFSHASVDTNQPVRGLKHLKPELDTERVKISAVGNNCFL